MAVCVRMVGHWTGVACMCTVQTTTAVQQAALHRAAPSPSSQHVLSPCGWWLGVESAGQCCCQTR